MTPITHPIPASVVDGTDAEADALERSARRTHNERLTCNVRGCTEFRAPVGEWCPDHAEAFRQRSVPGRPNGAATGPGKVAVASESKSKPKRKPHSDKAKARIGAGVRRAAEERRALKRSVKRADSDDPDPSDEAGAAMPFLDEVERLPVAPDAAPAVVPRPVARQRANRPANQRANRRANRPANRPGDPLRLPWPPARIESYPSLRYCSGCGVSRPVDPYFDTAKDSPHGLLNFTCRFCDGSAIDAGKDGE